MAQMARQLTQDWKVFVSNLAETKKGIIFFLTMSNLCLHGCLLSLTYATIKGTFATFLLRRMFESWHFSISSFSIFDFSFFFNLRVINQSDLLWTVIRSSRRKTSDMHMQPSLSLSLSLWHDLPISCSLSPRLCLLHKCIISLENTHLLCKG